MLPNTAQIPNVLFDTVMALVSPAEFKVLMAVARKTFGWGKTADSISLTQLEQVTGLSRQGVLTALGGLRWILKSKLVDHARYGQIRVYEIDLNVDIEGRHVVNSVDQGVVNSVDRGQSTQLTGVVNSVDQGQSTQLTGTSQLSRHTKPILKTQLLNPLEEEKSGTASAVSISASGLDDFDDLGLGGKHPARIAGLENWQKLENFWKGEKKKIGIFQLELYGKQLSELQKEGHNPEAVVLKALRRGWMDLRPLDKDEFERPAEVEAKGRADAKVLFDRIESMAKASKASNEQRRV